MTCSHPRPCAPEKREYSVPKLCEERKGRTWAMPTRPEVVPADLHRKCCCCSERPTLLVVHLVVDFVGDDFESRIQSESARFASSRCDGELVPSRDRSGRVWH